MEPQAAVPVFAELPQDAAPPHIRAIYDEICRWAAVPMVALIFRNLATHHGVLEEVWESVGPLFRSGRIQEAAWRTARTATLDGLVPPIEAHARAVIGLTDDALASVRNTLDAYNRANPVNLLTMLCLPGAVQDRHFGIVGGSRCLDTSGSGSRRRCLRWQRSIRCPRISDG